MDGTVFNRANGIVRLNRNDLLVVIKSAIQAQSFRFARQSIEAWEIQYPGDFELKYFLATCFLGERRTDRAELHLRELISIDIENLDALRLYLQKLPEKATSGKIADALFILGDTLQGVPVSENARLVRESIILLERNDIDGSTNVLYPILSVTGSLPLVALAHLRLEEKKNENLAVLNLAKVYSARFPDSLHFLHLLAKYETLFGDEKEGLELFTQCVSKDPNGLIGRRLWGNDHQFINLWPEELEINFELPIPADVASLLGWNILASGGTAPVINNEHKDNAELGDGNDDGKQASPDSTEEDHLAQQSTDIGTKNPQRTSYPGKTKPKVGSRKKGKLFPYYIIFSSKEALSRTYGEDGYTNIKGLLDNLAEQVRKKRTWGSIVYFPDDPMTINSLDVPLIEKVDAWNLKLSIQDLEKSLNKKGGMIGALLIVGGPQVIPFHELPNPTDDIDTEVPSDNPYGASDSNYFIPEWPVGRIPGDSGSDLAVILAQIQEATKAHLQPRVVFDPWWLRFISGLVSLFQKNKKTGKKTNRSFGYSAAVWRRSSLAVYRPIGDPSAVLVSPPVETGGISPERMIDVNLSYYNLHGLIDTAEWYGQPDLSDNRSQAEYPVALRTSDIIKNNRAPRIVFSEACYGANIKNKKQSDSIALRFLEIGCKAFIGSTSIAYGSVTTPLTGADLLGYFYWKNIRDGYSAGEALIKSKHEYVKEMTKRQGYLDAEDQKTLISFVLYGDPLAMEWVESLKPKFPHHEETDLEIIKECERQNYPDEIVKLPKEYLLEVKELVKPYLPGMDSAEVMVRISSNASEEKHGNSQAEPFGGRITEMKPDRYVVTMQGEVKSAKALHRHYASATIDNGGKILKLVVSR